MKSKVLKSHTLLFRGASAHDIPNTLGNNVIYSHKSPIGIDETYIHKHLQYNRTQWKIHLFIHVSIQRSMSIKKLNAMENKLWHTFLNISNTIGNKHLYMCTCINIYKREINTDICVNVYTHHKSLSNKLYRNMHTSIKHPIYNK